MLELITADDWLGETAAQIYEEYKNDLWTSAYTLLELLFVARSADRDVLETVVAARELVTVKGDVEAMIVAASYVDEQGMTPLDALHLLQSGPATIVSSDSTYDDFSDRLALESLVED